MIPGIPEGHTIAQAVGATYDEEIAVGGLLAANVLLAVIRSKAGEAPVGLDVSAFVVDDGTIVSSSEDTDGYALTVIYA